MSEFVVSKPASELRQGDRFIFAEDIGGEGEVVTVVTAADSFGTTAIETEELDFDVEVVSHQWLTLAPEEEEEDPPTCPNCDEELVSEDPRYCPVCDKEESNDRGA